MSNNVDATLQERGNRYGSFDRQARIVQNIKRAYGTAGSKYYDLADDQREALEMIAGKISRILNGDPNYTDSWHDIAGYARLVEERLIKDEEDAKIPF
jgi:hypothetical protein